MLNKNDIIETEIAAMSTDASGIARHDGMAVFVPGAALCERLCVRIVKAGKRCAYGRIESILQPSPQRAEPECAVYPRCGGCSLRHVLYEEELNYKAGFVKDTLRRIGHIEPSLAEIRYGEPTRYRNKAILPVALLQGKAVCGFYAARSHHVIQTDDCMLHPSVFSEIAAVFTGFVNEHGLSVYDETTHKGLVRALFIRKGHNSGQIMVMPIINGRMLPCFDELVDRLRGKFEENGLCSVMLNVNRKDTNVLLGEKSLVLWGSYGIEDTLCGVPLHISPHSFYQVNSHMAEVLYGIAAEYARPAGKTVLDLYCGTGSIGLSMAGQAGQVVGVDVVEAAIENARANAKNAGITNARFLCADAAQAAAEMVDQGVRPDVVLVDPPRKGLTPELIETIALDFAPERIVYISCDAATLARDAAIFAEKGYIVREGTPVDMFPRTPHVETVVLLQRQNT